MSSASRLALTTWAAFVCESLTPDDGEQGPLVVKPGSGDARGAL
jgi:hypothetical protein